MLSNSLAVMKRQRSELNLPELPLYGRSDLRALYDRMEIMPIGEPLIFEKEEKPSRSPLIMPVMSPVQSHLICSTKGNTPFSPGMSSLMI